METLSAGAGQSNSLPRRLRRIPAVTGPSLRRRRAWFNYLLLLVLVEVDGVSETKLAKAAC